MPTTRDHLHLLYELNRGLTDFVDLHDLLRYVTRRAREVFGADGCALLLLDRERHEFYFPVVSENDRAFEAPLQTLRFPADSGIAGWVLEHDQAALVADASTDARFYSGVDQVTKLTTRAVLCAPLRTRGGNVGVIEVVNPAPAMLTQEDLEFLETLAGDVAVAYEKTLLLDQLRGEVHGLRQACRVAGWVLCLLGVLFILGAVLSHMARALPLSELPTRPGTWMGLIGILGGVALTAIGRGWLVKRPS